MDMHHANIYTDLDCSDVHVAYTNYKEPLCGLVLNGFIEILVLGFLGIPLELGLLWLGITFVLRNKVDVPRDEVASKSKSKKGKSKKTKQSSAINNDQDNESDNEGLSEESDDDEMIEEVDTDEEEDQEQTKCCGRRKKGKKGSNEQKIG